jgi:hypothetical protein
MTKDEALRLALEALEDIGDEWGFTSQRTVPKRKEAITCLRLVIDAENISSKPMAWEQFYPEMGKPKLVEVQDGECKYCTDGCPACDARKLPEQKPIAWYDPTNGMVSTDKDSPLFTPLGQVWPLYTQRTWIGLTYEDMTKLQKDLYDAKGESVLPTTFAMAVEAKLKEKNNG